MLAVILGLLSLVILVNPVLAGEPPTQISPANTSTVTSSSLTWQTPTYPLYPTSHYRVQVDDDSSFASLNKDYYTNNTYYTPTLIAGTWFWKIKAKDETGTWSDWSSIWSFILTDSISSPTPEPSAAPTPSPSPNSIPTPSSFTISNTPSQINTDQSFSVNISLSLPTNPNTSFYLKGAFKKSDGSNYFGQTKVSGNWVKNNGSYSSQYQINTDSSGNWSGNLEVQPDNNDSGFTGTDDYIFKVGKYTSSGSGPSWSNESIVKIVTVEDQQEETVTENPSPTASPLGSPLTETKTTSSIQPKNNRKLTYRIASVAATTTEATPSDKPDKVNVKNLKQTNPFFWTGLIFVFAGTASIGYIYLKKNGKIHF